MKKKPEIIVYINLKGEIYDRMYSIQDIQGIVNLFNDIHESEIKLSIEKAMVMETKKKLR